ncbi:MAG TPA: lytic murein transglycosylase, partial [Smithellaceae bacterium]|nr:lytic murein transglycosylase [Smithellaceae bacterium]
RVTPARIEQGRAYLKEYRKILNKVSKTYGVQPHFLVALWGIESDYGAIKGSYPLVAALATLAFEGRRTAFFRRQLLDLLQLIDEGHIRNDATGSWAGAMGHTQFMPETYRKHAIDFDKDGRKDLWYSLADVFASSANYLALSGWEKGKGWGREVLLPEGFDYALCDLRIKKTLSEWRKLGVQKVGNGRLPQGKTEASLVLPGGADGGPALLVYQNFHVLLEWNRSILYAVSVGHLADRLTGAPAFRQPGKNIAALTLAESMELQRLLACWGYYKGEVDGIAGTKTREAIRIFQQENLLPADGYPSLRTLEYLRVKTNQI